MNGIFGIGIAELFFIAVIALVVLGPERLPATFRELAKYYRMARNLSGDLSSQFSEELKALDDINPQKIIQEVLDDPSLDDLKLDDINPTKISNDLAKDEAKNRKKTAPKKTTPKKTAAKKPTAKKTSTDSLSAVDSTESIGIESVADATDAEIGAAVTDDGSSTSDGTDEESSPVSSTADHESLTTETTAEVDATDVSESDVDSSEDVVADGAPDGTDDAATAEESTAGVDNAPAEMATEVDAVDEDTLPDNRIAPDELTANLEQDAPSQDAIPSEPASLSVNGTHDSVEDRA